MLSITYSSLATNSFAATSTTTLSQHIPNKNSVKIESVTIDLLKTSTSRTASAKVSIVENGDEKGSASATDLDTLKAGTYNEVTVKFDPAVKVDKDFDIVVEARQFTVHTYIDAKNRTPGYLIDEDGVARATRDLDLELNGKLLMDYKTIFQTQPTTSGDENDGETDTSGSGNQDDNSTSTDSIKLRVQAKNLKDNADVNGMWVAVLEGITMSASGWTDHTFDLKKGDYTIFMDDYADQATGTTYKFVKWSDSTKGKFRDATLSKDETFTAIYDIQTTASSPPPTSNNTGGTDGGGNDNGGTSTAGGPNTVTISSQLLDGTPITGLEAQLRESATGNNVGSNFTTATLQMQDGKDYRAIMYSFSPTWFRHWTDGGLHRYHLVSGDGKAHSLTAVFEKISPTQEADLTIKAIASDGTPIGGTTGTQEDNTLQAEAGLEVQIAPPMSTTPYTAGFTGGSEASPFHLFKGQTYTVVMEEFGKYKFSHWQDNGSQNSARAVTLNSGSTTLTAVYDIIS